MELYFPTVEELMTVLSAELPEDVYATDRADDPDPAKRSSTSSEMRAVAMLYSDIYNQLENTHDDNSISTVTVDGLVAWEQDLFSAAQDSSQSPAYRQQNLLSKRRAIGGISLPAIHDIVAGILTPVGLSFQLIAYSGATDDTTPGASGAWILEESALDVGTWLGYLDPLQGARQDEGYTPLDCNLDYAAAGLTAEQLTEIQLTAYGYEVRIFGNADSSTLTLLDQRLTAQEPARSAHTIVNNASGPISAADLGPGQYSFGQ